MTTIAHDLDDVQRFLKDAPAAGQDGVTWTRAELLSYYQDGYRDLVAQPQATRRFSVLDVPPRFTYSGTQRFEQRYASGGTFFPCTHGASSGSGWTSSSLFEVELVEGYTSTSASEGLTHPWERAYVSPAYTPFRFGVHRAHRRIGKLWYDNRLLQPVTVRELDRMDTNWISLAGEPVAWTLGTGDTSSLEVFEVATTYSATYATSGEGMLRYLSGARTYTAAYDGHAPTNASFAYSTSGEARALELTQLLSGFGAGLTQPAVNGYQGVHVWEYQMLASLSQTDDTTAIPCFAWEAPWSQTVQYAMGAVRALSSPDRQYWPVVEWADQVPLGKIDRLQSSENALLLLEGMDRTREQAYGTILGGETVIGHHAAIRSRGRLLPYYGTGFGEDRVVGG